MGGVVGKCTEIGVLSSELTQGVLLEKVQPQLAPSVAGTAILPATGYFLRVQLHKPIVCCFLNLQKNGPELQIRLLSIFFFFSSR